LLLSVLEGWGILDTATFDVVTIACVICGTGIFVAAVSALGEHIADKGRQE